MSSAAIASFAEFSPCRKYRYLLGRELMFGEGTVLFVMLNPSVASESHNDMTISRCIDFAMRWNFHRLLVVNQYALVSTDPAGLERAEDPIGPDNDAVIARTLRQADRVIAAWGFHGNDPARLATIQRLVEESGKTLEALDVTKDGHPKHPARLAASLVPKPYSIPLTPRLASVG